MSRWLTKSHPDSPCRTSMLTATERQTRSPAPGNAEVTGALCEYFEKRVSYWDEIYSGSDFMARHINDRKIRVLELVDQISGGNSFPC